MDLDAWLAEHIGCEQRRAEVRANVDCLSDFRVASLEDLEDALGLAAWPALPKKRFLDAWRRAPRSTWIDFVGRRFGASMSMVS